MWMAMEQGSVVNTFGAYGDAMWCRDKGGKTHKRKLLI